MAPQDNNHENARKHSSFAVGALVLLITVLLLSTVAYAGVKLTAPLNSYDDGTQVYENGNVEMLLNFNTQPFSEVLGYDGVQVADACGPGSSTPWAGTVLLGHDHLDTNGAKGFQSTLNWYAVDCTTFSKAGNNNRYPTADEKLVECVPDNVDGKIDSCEIVAQDAIGPCTPAGRCQNEIDTSVQGNLDLDCDGAIDDYIDPAHPGRPLSYIRDLVAGGNLCFYWEAVKPPIAQPGDSVWGGNIQSRINAGGGDKTVNFNFDPLAIKLESFEATCQEEGPLLTWQTTSETDNLGFNIWRSTSQESPTDLLDFVPSQAPGSGSGFPYSWTDTAAPVTAWYWLEDVSFDGATQLHGPVSASCGEPLAVGLSKFAAERTNNLLVFALLAASTLVLVLGYGLYRKLGFSR